MRKMKMDEHMFILLGMGEKLIGSIHMYWVEK